MAEKYKTCKHSTGRVGELIVYVHPTCPRLSMIKGTYAAVRSVAGSAGAGRRGDDRNNRCNGCWCADWSLWRDRLGIKCRKQG